MEMEWIDKRMHLRRLLHEHPDWSDPQYAEKVGMSRSWVQKWRKRIEEHGRDNILSVTSRSRRPKSCSRWTHEVVEARIIDLREQLTEQYGRRVGARNILFHLHRDEDLKRTGHYIPKSPTTIHNVLVRYHRVPRRSPRQHEPIERPPAMTVWEIDFADVPTASSADTHKKAHQVEMFSVIDAGTSIAIDSIASDRFDAEWTLITLIDLLTKHGCPRIFRFDRDPRFITSWSADGFPSALMRFLLSIGVKYDICPPHRPDLKPFIERFVRTQKEEAIYPKQPDTVEVTQIVIDEQLGFYNYDRPNQALSCRNLPPKIAHPDLPILPRLPAYVDPDAWLKAYHNHVFKRVVRSSGSVDVDKHSYYVHKRFAGQKAMLVVNAETKQFDIQTGEGYFKSRDIKGLFHGEMPFVDYVDYIVQDAKSEARRLQQKQRRYSA